MMTSQCSGTGGYVLAFLAGAVGGLVLAKRAPALKAKMQQHCMEMMEAGCCGPGDQSSASCCGTHETEADQQVHHESQAA